jgi:hypothetical protein
MKYSLFIITGIAAALFGAGLHMGADAYKDSRQLQAQAEGLTIRTRLMRHQLGELEQKVRVLDRVGGFVDQAASQRLTPQQWSVYEVNIQDALSFAELARIIEQCDHGEGLVFKPISFHVSVGGGQAEGDAGGPSKPLKRADDADSAPADATLELQGAFLVRH